MHVEFNNTTLLYGLFNQYVFSEAKMNIDYLKMYYKQKGLFGNNTLITRLIGLINDYTYTDLTESRFQLTLQQDGRTLDESNMIYASILKFQGYEKDQAKVFIENLKDVCYTAWIEYCQKKHAADPVKYLEDLKTFNYKSNYSDTLVAKSFDELDLTDLVNRYSAEGYKSRYKFINDSFTCGGYIPGQIVIISAAPSTGKSLFLQSEAVNFIQQGKRVHLLTLGDLNELDVSIRMMCQISGKSQRQIESDILGNYELYKGVLKQGLSITVVPSGSVTPREYVDWMLSRIDEYDVLMIDYDSNFKRDETKSMYDLGGEAYDALTELTRLGKLVFVASQPKQSYFGEEYIPYEGIGESSRKIHIADMIITIGRRWEAGMPMGIMNIAKNRRGEKAEAYWIRTNEGLFYCASDVLYAKYRSNKTQKKLFSHAELQTMDILDSSIADALEETIS